MRGWWRDARRRAGAGVAIGGAMVALAALATPAAAAEFEIESLTTTTSDTRAGAHPDVTVDVRFSRDELGQLPAGDLRDLIIDMPAGMVGNVQAVDECPDAQFYNMLATCPATSQVGGGTLHAWQGSDKEHVLNIFRLRAPSNEPARLGLKLVMVPGVSEPPVQVIRFAVRTGEDYGLRTISENIARPFPITGLTLNMWGVPYDHSGVGRPMPFMTSPTECETIPRTAARARSYQKPSRWTSAVADMDHPADSCESLVFEPQIQVRPESRTAGAASAVNVEILVPQNEDPNGRATPHLKGVEVKLPEGLTINPGTARDLTACTDNAFGVRGDGPHGCPAGSRVGSLGITTPLLPEAMSGAIYIGEPKPGDLFRLFLYAEGRGVRVKLVGSVRPDPKTGQLTAHFAENPQLPFSRLHLRFRGGNQAVLAMPETCGVKATTAGMSSWAGLGATVGSQFQVFGDDAGAPCAESQPFAPTFVAGTTSPVAGADTGLTLAFGRSDQDQTLGGLKLELPAGLLGRLAAFPQCPLAKLNANACDESSLVGDVKVAAGAGTALLNLPGKVFLAEPFKPDQIASLGIVVRAVAGPYDLGTVIVKSGIHVNPDTSLSVETEPLPTILEGVPLRIRQVQVNVDRPGFMFNPTDCSPKRIDATVLSSGGAEAKVASPFQVRGCNALEFSPPMTIEATAPAPLTRVMGLEVNLGGLGGQANARQVQVVLPPPIGARLDGPVQTQCTEAQFALDACSPESRVGTARADTPVLSTPLAGDVFFLENVSGGNLPRLAVRLKGEVLLDLVADVEITEGGRYTTTFGAVPDVPISNFRLKLEEGSQAILTAAPICGKKLSAERNMIAHNGKFTNDRIPVTVAGCTGTKKKSQKASQKQSARKGKAGNKRRGA